jgi:tetratricopeptide (TPR) repeat protein
MFDFHRLWIARRSKGNSTATAATWPADMSEVQFGKRCVRLLRYYGWDASPYIAGKSCWLERLGDKLFVTFVPPGHITLATTLRDLRESAYEMKYKHGLAFAIICYDPVSPPVAELAAKHGALVANYQELPARLTCPSSRLRERGRGSFWQIANLRQHKHRLSKRERAVVWEQVPRDISNRNWSKAIESLAALDESGEVPRDGKALWVAALREAGRFDEAKVLSKRFLAEDETMVRLWIETALIDLVKRDWPTAGQAFTEIRSRFPREAEAYLRGAQIAREMGNRQEVDALLSEAIDAFPKREDIAHYYASYANALKDWHEAARRWRTFSARFPNHPDGEKMRLEALAKCGAPEEANDTNFNHRLEP